MSESLKAASYAAGLSEKDRRKIESLGKALAVHKNLLAMPSDAAMLFIKHYQKRNNKIL